MFAHEIATYVSGETRRTSKRVGRGIGSGHGKTCGRGHKGAGSRSGTKLRLAFEGGQTPVFRRVAKRGFTGSSKRSFVLDIKDILESFPSSATVSIADLLAAGMVPRRRKVKVLNTTNITAASVTVIGCRVSASVAALSR
jgi:large subunit ribosomal protein L15